MKGSVCIMYCNDRTNAVVAQSGGPTSAINATLAGVIKGALESKKISRLYGSFNGIDGILRNDICDLTSLFDDNEYDIQLLSKTPAAALGSCRTRLPSLEENDINDIYFRIFDFFEKHGIGYFFYIGGNDSMDTVMKLSEYARSHSLGIQFIGVPKTIDNDLFGIDHTPGYGSAAKYIASTVSEIVRDCAVYTVKSVTIVEIMGRDAGWLAAAADLPNYINGSGPDLVYFPEKTFSIEKFYSDIEEKFKNKPNIVVAVSEGIRYSDGTYVGEGRQSGATDIFGHKYLAGTAKVLEQEIKSHFGCKVRSIELSLPQRCAGHMMSETDRLESIEIGKKAVSFAEDGANSCLICSKRTPGDYGLEFLTERIADVANKIRTLPDEYINETENGITEKFRDYIMPLIIGETQTEYCCGLPKYYIIKN